MTGLFKGSPSSTARRMAAASPLATALEYSDFHAFDLGLGDLGIPGFLWIGSPRPAGREVSATTAGKGTEIIY